MGCSRLGNSQFACRGKQRHLCSLCLIQLNALRNIVDNLLSMTFLCRVGTYRSNSRNNLFLPFHLDSDQEDNWSRCQVDSQMYPSHIQGSLPFQLLLSFPSCTNHTTESRYLLRSN